MQHCRCPLSLRSALVGGCPLGTPGGCDPRLACAALLAPRYDYDEDASAIVERLHDEYLYNQELGCRLVDSGNWTYSVDLKQVREVRAALALNKS